MFGPRLTSIFKSRWTALLWAGLVIWTAVDFVGSGQEGNSTSETTSALPPGDEAVIAHMLDDRKQP
ncbi:MAG TPA: hypothetical protein VF475_06775 [Sphingobium sp.]